MDLSYKGIFYSHGGKIIIYCGGRDRLEVGDKIRIEWLEIVIKIR